MSHWPPVFITDVTTFLMKYESEEKAQLHLNQYKIGKAYEYYTSEWLKEVFYHPVSTSPYCFLRARCTPSQSLNAATHSAWVCLQKATGHVLSAYCSCTSGPLVGKSKADYDVMPEANNDTAACIQKTLLASLKDAIPNACVFKGMHTTDDQDTTHAVTCTSESERKS
uniref:Uncharacterized protein n=1 Tax=Magallana gigas TaxID=29159 RepID=A0A8W8JIZ6_MAGGI